MRRLFATLCLIALTCLPAGADTLIQTRTVSGGDQPNSQMDMLADAYTDGTRVQVYFRESSNPWMKSGMYLFSPDGGTTLFLVDPKEETYSEWDLEALLQFAGAMLRGMGPLLQFEIRDPDVKLVSEGPGPVTLGMPTKEHKLESSYTLSMRILGMKREQTVRESSTILTTKELPATALGVWLRSEPPKIGHGELDKLIAANWAPLQDEGLTVVREVQTVMTTKKGKEQRSWSKFETLKFDDAAGGPPGGYGFPDSYQQVSMMPTEEEMAGGSGDDGEKGKKKRFGGLFNKGG